MTTIINAVTSTGLVQTSDGSGVIKVQSNGVTTNALAWVLFDGTASPGTIRAQYNVSSVTRNSTGNFTVNFTNALADANYAVGGLCGSLTTGTPSVWGETGTRTTSAYQFATGTSVGVNTNYTYTSLLVFGN